MGEKVSANQEKIINLISKNQSISNADLAKKVGIADKNIENNLSKLKNKGLIKRIGPDKGGHWEIIR